MHALFPGSFNPITLGHMDIITRAVRLCDKLFVVVVGQRSIGDVQQRVALAQLACAQFPTVEVIAHHRLLVDCAAAVGATVIIRGVRSSSDLGYEHNMANMNRTLGGGIETVLLPTSQAVGHISASLVRQVITSGGDAAPFLPPVVWQSIQEHRYYGA